MTPVDNFLTHSHRGGPRSAGRLWRAAHQEGIELNDDETTIGRMSPEPDPFALASAAGEQEGHVHGIAPGAERGAALCGVRVDRVIACTRWPLYLIACATCRSEAAALLAERWTEGTA